eukprot:TRINITY_DN963_c0_g1_i5.p2 TRINITY_DN963_c0_g1~~TRINITY_DN963_c0_g1_i5.p2  ORF type:complete len:150 (-),score=36.03 TRINITY_DN963_c0_g1_i5:388-837(-)
MKKKLQGTLSGRTKAAISKAAPAKLVKPLVQSSPRKEAPAQVCFHFGVSPAPPKTFNTSKFPPPAARQDASRTDTSGSSEDQPEDQPFAKDFVLDQQTIEGITKLEQSLLGMQQALKYSENVGPTCNRWWTTCHIQYRQKLLVCVRLKE